MQADNWNRINRIVVIFLISYLVIRACLLPANYAELDSNALPVISLQYRGSVFMNQSDIEQARKDFPTLYKDVDSYEDLRSAKLIKVTEDRWMSYYFPVYPLFCIPVKLLLTLFDVDQEKCFALTNALLMALAFWFVYKKLKVKPVQRFLAIAMLALSPAVFYYVNYICYEAFAFSMLTVSLVQYCNGKYKSSAFALSLGGMSNSAVMAVGIVMICEYLCKLFYGNRGRGVIAIIRENFVNTFLYGLCYVPCLIPFIVQRVCLSHSVYAVTSEGLNGFQGRALAYLFDPTLGFCTFAPLAVIAFFVLAAIALIKRRWNALVWLLFLIGAVVAVSFMMHINCGMVYCSRYVVWIYPIIPLFLATIGFDVLRIFWVKILCYSLILLSSVCFLKWNEDTNRLYFNNCAEWLLNNVPELYNPLSSTFYSRILHIDGGYYNTQPVYHKNKQTDEITKLLYKADEGAGALVLNDVTGDEESLRYLEKEIGRNGTDGRFHYVDFPSWKRYRIYEKDISEKEGLTEGNVLADKMYFSLKPNDKKQSKRFKTKIKGNTYYKIELQLAEDFDFSEVEDFNIKFCGKNSLDGQEKGSAFLVKDRYEYTFYFYSGELKKSKNDYMKIVMKTKTHWAEAGKIRRLRVVEMMENEKDSSS